MDKDADIQILKERIARLEKENRRLRASEERVRGYIRQSHSGIVFLDNEGRIEEWNERASEITGISFDDVAGKYLWNLIDIMNSISEFKIENSDILAAEMIAYINGYSSRGTEFGKEIKLTDGEAVKYSYLSIFPISVDNRNFFWLTIDDISKEKKNELEFEKYQEHLEDVLKERTLELINSEYRLKNLSDSLPGGAIFRLIQFDKKKLKLDYVSKNFYELLGLDPDIDFYKLNEIFKRIHPDDFSFFQQQKRLALHSSDDFSAEVRYLLPTGGMKWFHVRAKANYTDPDDVYWDGYVIDTTEKNLYHTELLEREALLQSVLENIPYDFWATDENGEYFIQSKASLQYWDTLNGSRIQDLLIPKKSKDVFQQIFENVIGGEIVNEENILFDKRKRRYIFQTIAAPIMINNQVKGALGFNIDITERKNVETRLVQNEDKFRNIFNNSTDGIIIHANDGIIYESNSTFRIQSKVDRSHLLGENILEFIDIDAAAKFMQALESLGNNETDFIMEASLNRKDDDFMPIEIRSKVIHYLGKEAILTIIRNISYRKRFERQLFDAIIETEEKERAKLAADLHDEIGPLLSSMKMYISLLKDTKDIEKSNYVGQQVFDLVTEAITSIREISNSLSPHVLTNYGLIEAAKNVIQSVSKFVEIEFHNNCQGIRFGTNTETVFYRIFRELLNNTLKHADATVVKITFLYEEDTLTFIYNDNGKGFDYEKEFENKKEGMGLFNIINRAKTIAAKYTFNSVPTKGTYFEMSTKISL